MAKIEKKPRIKRNLPRPAHRPSEYQENYPDEVYSYLQTVGDGTCKMPKRCDVELLLDCDDKTLKKWELDHELFRTAMRRVDIGQKSQLMDDGMYGGKEVNPQIAKFLLSANHGMAETERREVTGAEGKDLFPETFSITLTKKE